MCVLRVSESSVEFEFTPLLSEGNSTKVKFLCLLSKRGGTFQWQGFDKSSWQLPNKPAKGVWRSASQDQARANCFSRRCRCFKPVSLEPYFLRKEKVIIFWMFYEIKEWAFLWVFESAQDIILIIFVSNLITVYYLLFLFL